MNFLTRNSIFIIVLVALVTITLFFAIKINPPESIILNVTGNQQILHEIDSLLPALEAKNITSHDFNQLSRLVDQDAYASGEIVELKALAEDREYSHIGHSLGFLYQYVKTGVAPVCPGHSLSHYYVFTKHGQTSLAASNLNDSKQNIGIFVGNLILKNSTNMTEINEFENNFHSAILQIEGGNSSASEEQISYFADASCS